MRVTHYDRLEVRWDASTLRTNGDETRTVDGFGAHVGPYTYHDDKGDPFVEIVPASTLFDQASLDSAAGSTLTIRHGPGLVTPDRYQAEAHGAWVKAWDAGGGQLGVRVRVSSRDGLDFIDAAIAAGEPVELSPVYEVDVVERPTADGGRELVQEGRDYSGIAMLGPNEARGGPSAKLKLDGRQRAPAGSRVEARRPRLDSAADPRLSFKANRRSSMKNATITSKGRSRAVSLDGLAILRALKSDAMETGTITIEVEGEEPDVLVLPTEMIKMLLEGIGVSSAPAAEPADVEAELEQVESLAADAEEDEDKMDAKTVRRMIADALATDRAQTKRSDARAARVHADAATILPPAYDFSVAWQQVCVDAIAKVAPELEARAKKLAADSRSDPEAAGMLRQMLSERRGEGDAGVSTLKTKVVGDGEGAKPWLADTMPTGAEQ